MEKEKILETYSYKDKDGSNWLVEHTEQDIYLYSDSEIYPCLIVKNADFDGFYDLRTLLLNSTTLEISKYMYDISPDVELPNEQLQAMAFYIFYN